MSQDGTPRGEGAATGDSPADAARRAEVSAAGAAPPPGVRNTPGVATDGNGAAVSAEGVAGGGRETAGVEGGFVR